MKTKVCLVHVYQYDYKTFHCVCRKLCAFVKNLSAGDGRGIIGEEGRNAEIFVEQKAEWVSKGLAINKVGRLRSALKT